MRLRLLRFVILAACVVATACGHSAKSRNTSKPRVLKRIPLATRTAPPTFQPAAGGLALLDRWRLVLLGSRIEDRSTLELLDLTTLEVGTVVVPDLGGPRPPAPNALVVERLLFYDTELGTAGVLARAGGDVTGAGVYAEWDLRQDRIVRTLPLFPGGAATQVRPMGIDLNVLQRECFLEVRRGREVSVLGVAEQVRRIATFTLQHDPAPYGPWFDAAYRRSLHLEYADGATLAHLVDLTRGTVATLTLPPLTRAFDFSHAGGGFLYSEATGELRTVNLRTGATGKSARLGGGGDARLETTGPGEPLVLVRGEAIHRIDPHWFFQLERIGPLDFLPDGARVEGSLIVLGGALVRAGDAAYLVELPRLMQRTPPRPPGAFVPFARTAAPGAAPPP